MTKRPRLAAAGMALACALGLAGCERERPESSASEVSPIPRAPSALDRADLVAALEEDASLHAAGMPLGSQALVGQAFEVRLPFGCPGEASGVAGVARLDRSADGRGLRLSLVPADLARWASNAAADGAPASERVEGYWIARPWLKSEACPPAPPAPAVPEPATEAGALPVLEPLIPLAPPPTPETAGLAVVHDLQSSRLGRRDGQAYEYVVRGSGGRPAAAPADGFRLVLSGRIATFPDGRASRCGSPSPGVRPTCVLAVELDRVAFDAGGRRLAEWRPG